MENYNGFCNIAPAENGEYAVIRTNGETGILTTDGEFHLMYSAEYSADDYEGGYYPYLISCVNGEIYVAEGLYGDSIFKVSDGYIEQYLSVGDFPGIEEYGMFSMLSAYDGDLAVAVDNTVYIADDSGTFFNGGYTLPLEQTAAVLAKKICPVIAGIFIVLGLVSCIGCLMNWRFSLLSKQLWLIIPIVGLVITLLVASMIDSIGESFDKQITQQMIAIAELSVKMLDGDKIEAMTTMDCVSDGSLYALSEQLSDMIDRNSDDWSRTFDSKICLKRDNLYISLAYSGGYTMPFGDFSYIDSEQVSTGADDRQDTVISYIYGTGVNEMIADTPIYNSNGECVAYFELSADISTIDDELYEMKMKAVKQALISAPVLIAALALITFFSVRVLRSARSTVGKIADGDFTARIADVPNDEIGEICVGVNNMAEQLQTLFEQKDNNEKFYYKFVPEKFRELLHKENFTELSLGDAESADLTVLFCDIRSFSLNSEMMTAKENFEFVNIIYGIAGPIIRSNGGFVDKYIGDAVMALFENADSAVEAGTELYREIVLNPATAERLGVSSVNIGIGIHSGMARVGIVGEEERMSGTVISNTVNLSSRLESLTKQYSTAMIISKDTLDRLSDPDSLHTRYLGMIQVAGVNEVKALYEVLDCLDEKRKAERTANEKDFREAVRMFHLGDLNGSVDLFRKAAAESENDPVPNMYIEYITQKINDGDFEHNVFKFRKK
jgi:class 3 adenylate cyclase/HAMP domain-containing protein